MAKTEQKAKQLELTAITKENISFFEPMLADEITFLIKNNLALAMGAVADGIACAIIVAQPGEEFAQLIWIYVAKDYRREYIGGTLFCEMAEFLQDGAISQARGIGCDYSVDTDNDTGLHQFLKAMNFTSEESGEYCASLTLAQLAESDLSKKPPPPSNEIAYSFVSNLSPFHLNQLNDILEKNEANFTGNPVTQDTVLPDCSTVMYRGDTPTGCVCVCDGDNDNEKILSIVYINEKSSKPITGMFSKTAAALIEKYSPQTILKIPIVSESAGKLAKALVKDSENITEKAYTAVHLFLEDSQD
jgi:ribosomal protein S18 acetylase RimI-like enzyme